MTSLVSQIGSGEASCAFLYLFGLAWQSIEQNSLVWLQPQLQLDIDPFSMRKDVCVLAQWHAYVTNVLCCTLFYIISSLLI